MTKPNVLLIVVDQLRYDCVGFAQLYPTQTPNIDRLAGQATWFSNSFTPIPTCCPARQSFLTSKRAEELGTLWNYDMGPVIPSITPDRWTWTQSYADAGYRMAYVGKWHASATHGPTDFGFASFTGEPDYEAFRRAKYPNVHYRPDYLGEDDPLPLHDSRTHWLTQRAIEQLGTLSRGADPWLVRLDLSEPHLPCRPAAPFSSLFTPSDIPKWKSFEEDFTNKPYMQRQQLANWQIEGYSWDDWAPIVARYYNVIAQVDDAIGQLLATLETLGISDDTVVIFTADHGDMCGGHRMLDKHYVLYDDVVHVPLVIRLPGQTEALVYDGFSSNMLDIGPTLLDLAGIDLPSDLHGRSLAAVLRGENDPDPRTQIVSTFNGQQFGLYSLRMLRDADWKYIWNATDVDELYDLRSDPDELVNLAGKPEMANRIADMRKRLDEELVGFGDRLVDNPWLSDQLNGLSAKLPPAPPPPGSPARSRL